MIKSYAVTITEIDDEGEAARQVAEKVASFPLMKNTMGIAFAHPEFVSSGVYARVAAALPFPLVGTTAISHCAGGAVGTYMLSVLVLTSDDCSFSCGMSGVLPKTGGVKESELACACYEAAAGKLPDKPAMAFIYAPFYDKPYVGACLNALSRLTGGLPLFGAVANDDQSASLTETGARVLFGGEAFDDRLAIAVVSGPVEPKFHIISATDESMIMPRVGVITAISECRITEINNMNALEFFRSVGFPVDDPSNNSGLLSSIFILHINEGNDCVSVSRIPHGVAGGGILCGGDIVEGAVLSVAFNTQEMVLETAEQAAEIIKKGNGGGTAIIHTCLGRRYGLLSDPMAELELLRGALGNFNCVAAYANGEICPTGVAGGKADNRFHNQTLVACVF